MRNRLSEINCKDRHPDGINRRHGSVTLTTTRAFVYNVCLSSVKQLFSGERRRFDAMSVEGYLPLVEVRIYSLCHIVFVLSAVWSVYSVRNGEKGEIYYHSLL